ncbi:uncharacterized protein LOC135924562 isoform X2 [Gordionus sp. m RMFG-2023]|uniref:uncharacterized protein LOC135924562 isoform X2 n=1 Tax=Gordionus sp. m RMFG-2023 TaxID=3053472 RepID=UPI0031FD4CAE
MWIHHMILILALIFLNFISISTQENLSRPGITNQYNLLTSQKVAIKPINNVLDDNKPDLYNEPFTYGNPSKLVYVLIFLFLSFVIYFMCCRKSKHDDNRKRSRLNIFRRFAAYLIEGRKDQIQKRRPNPQYQQLIENSETL